MTLGKLVDLSETLSPLLNETTTVSLTRYFLDLNGII